VRTPRSTSEPLVGPRARSTRHGPAPVSKIRRPLFPSDWRLRRSRGPAQPDRPRMDRRRFSGKTGPSSGDPAADRSFEAADERTYPSRVEPLVAIRLPSLAGPWADRARHDCLHSVVRHGPNGRNAVPPGISQEAARQNNRITTPGGLRRTLWIAAVADTYLCFRRDLAAGAHGTSGRAADGSQPQWPPSLMQRSCDT
jgi:hypothetical protein